MIAVDTSVWVGALRDGESPATAVLKDLLDDDRVVLLSPVRVELLAGTGVSGQRRLRRLLSALPLWTPTRSTWALVDSWLEPAARAGERFGFADLLIGATAAAGDAPIWSLDTDFARMARLGFVEVFDRDA